VYYTPRAVVGLQVRLATEVLEKRFGKKLGFADDGVVFLDPAIGTGTYPVAAVKNALEKVRIRSGEGALPARASQMAENMYGFEILVGPYAVAHLRLTQALEGSGAHISTRLKIYLADTLESPNASPSGGLVEATLALEPEINATLKAVVEGQCFEAIELPFPTSQERELPLDRSDETDQANFFDDTASDEQS
jgi:predicted helicase